MTNKRKIQILKKVIKRFEKIIKSGEYYNENGICDTVNFQCMTDVERKEYLADNRDTNEIMSKDFKIRLPKPINVYGYCWEHNKKGYQARIKACQKAIERLSK